MKLSKWDLEAAVARVRQVPTDFKPSLLGPTAVRKVFFKQDEALEFARPYGPDMMVYSYESESLGQAGPRMFLACSVQSFFHYYRQMPSTARCHYEVIAFHRPAKLYLDLEFAVTANPDRDGPEAAALFVKALCSALLLFYNVHVQSGDIVTLDASTVKKFSQHVIINSDQIAFQSNVEQGQLVRLVIEALQQFSNGCNPGHTEVDVTDNPPGCQLCRSAIQSLISEAFPKAGIRPEDAAKCFVYSSATGDQACRTLVSICDSGVYTRNRNFRLAGSHKLNGVGVLWPVGLASEPKSLLAIWPTCLSWAQTLVTFFQTEPSVTFQRPLIDCTCSFGGGTTYRSPHSGHRDPVSTGMHLTETKTIPALLTTDENSLTPDLACFVLSVLRYWFERGIQSNPVHNAWADPVQSKRWKLHHFGPGRFTVSVDGLRFCERVDRPHRSNHVILVFDLNQGCYYQKCLDPDCRMLDYRSLSYPIPQSLLAPASVNVSEPICSSNAFQDCSFHDPMVTEEDVLLCAVLDKFNTSRSSPTL